MVVWIEIAILENFVLDGVLLFLSLKAARAKVKVFRLLLASALGAAEAVVFPVLDLPAWCAYLVKFLGGVLLVAVALSSKRIKDHLIAVAAFFFLTFALGGCLTAVYSFAEIEYAESGGYLVGSVPAGLLLGVSAGFAIAVFYALRAFYRYRKMQKNLLPCTLTAAGREVNWQGYADSGNNLVFRGKPVCVVSPAAVFALFGRDLKEAGRIEVGTVNGTKRSPVFECERMKIGVGGKTVEREGVFLTVGNVGKNYQLILNTALMEA